MKHGKIKIDGQADRENMLIALANNGYAVRVVEKGILSDKEYYILFDYEATEDSL